MTSSAQPNHNRRLSAGFLYEGKNLGSFTVTLKNGFLALRLNSEFRIVNVQSNTNEIKFLVENRC